MNHHDSDSCPDEICSLPPNQSNGFIQALASNRFWQSWSYLFCHPLYLSLTIFGIVLFTLHVFIVIARLRSVLPGDPGFFWITTPRKKSRTRNDISLKLPMAYKLHSALIMPIQSSHFYLPPQRTYGLLPREFLDCLPNDFLHRSFCQKRKQRIDLHE